MEIQLSLLLAVFVIAVPVNCYDGPPRKYLYFFSWLRVSFNFCKFRGSNTASLSLSLSLLLFISLGTMNMN